LHLFRCNYCQFCQNHWFAFNSIDIIRISVVHHGSFVFAEDCFGYSESFVFPYEFHDYFFLNLWWKSLVIFFSGTGFEVRASSLLGSYFTTWAMPPAPFLSDYFGDRVLIFAQAGLFYGYLSLGRQVYPLLPIFFHQNGGLINFFFSGWPETRILPISTSHGW
jgi:hypothetical protein